MAREPQGRGLSRSGDVSLIEIVAPSSSSPPFLYMNGVAAGLTTAETGAKSS